jgi:hypothetical protein
MCVPCKCSLCPVFALFASVFAGLYCMCMHVLLGALAFESDFAQATSNAATSLSRSTASTATAATGAPSVSPASTPLGVLSWRCYSHCTSLLQWGFDTQNVGGITMRMALHATMEAAKTTGDKGKGKDNTTLLWMDTCNSFNCGPGCKLLKHDKAWN